jgi:hypothetical protein
MFRLVNSTKNIRSKPNRTILISIPIKLNNNYSTPIYKEAIHSQIRNSGNDLGVRGNDLSDRGNDLGSRGDNLGERGNDLGSRGNDLGDRGNDLGDRGNNLGSRGKHLGDRGKHFWKIQIKKETYFD